MCGINDIVYIYVSLKYLLQCGSSKPVSRNIVTDSEEANCNHSSALYPIGAHLDISDPHPLLQCPLEKLAYESHE